MKSRVIGWIACLVALAAPCAAQEGPGPVLAPDREVLDELKSAPGANPERVERLVELYRQAGATDDVITRTPIEARREGDPPLDNVVITKPGETDLVIVVGGHLDKVRRGGGVIDDWSGACMTANLYQALRAVPTRHTFRFVGFAYEEQGLVGSGKFVEALTEEERGRVRAMINLECLGVGGPFLWTNGSTDALEAVAHQVAERSQLPLIDHVIEGVGADSIPFERVGIPNLTFDGLPVDRFQLIHSDQDLYENIDPKSYVTTYRLVTHFLLELDRAPDEVFAREAPAPPPAPVGTSVPEQPGP